MGKYINKINMAKPILVIDSNAIIKHQDLDNLATKYRIYSVPSLVSEIKDPISRDKLRNLNFEINYVMPDKPAINFVLDFSKKTGDYISISPVDGQVIALAYEL